MTVQHSAPQDGLRAWRCSEYLDIRLHGADRKAGSSSGSITTEVLLASSWLRIFYRKLSGLFHGQNLLKFFHPARVILFHSFGEVSSATRSYDRHIIYL
ncbi:hypothetical protein A0H81_11848 [Grifola frondosa]|uniref:Uncharacterized protein n=1 Tax=Grifola frondosa TaxID=5627 RepID=A0A1C7LW73_GRIFR|nr:hypothetical protein A0H81_11848 [Grifola frondosa]